MGRMITIEGPENIQGYLADIPDDPKGAIIVIHEVWGLVDHIKEVADRYAKEGYIALAPDLLFMLDFKSTDVAQLQKDLFNPQTRNAVQPELRRLMAPLQEPEFGDKTVERLETVFNYLYNLQETKQNIAITGFCFGGSYSYALAVKEPRLKLALPFYGHADQPVEDLKNIKCPVEAFYGEKDEGLVANLPDLEKRMEDAGVDFSYTVYPDCGHAFFNDSNPFAYNEEARNDSWQKALNKLSSVGM